MFEQAVRHTSVVLTIVSVDDGSTSAEGRAVLKQRGVYVEPRPEDGGPRRPPRADSRQPRCWGKRDALCAAVVEPANTRGELTSFRTTRATPGSVEA